MENDFLCFNDGIANIYAVDNIASPGDQPKQGLKIKHAGLRFEYKTIGVHQNYEALQANVRLDEQIQIPMHREISSQDVAVINGRQYEIIQARHLTTTNPPSSKLTLLRREVDYELAID